MEFTRPELIAKQMITVESDGARGIEVIRQPIGEMDVSVAVPEDAQQPPDSLQIGLRPAEASRSPIIRAYKWNDGVFHFEPMPSGNYWLVAHTGSAPFCVDSARLDGQDVLKNILTLSPDAKAHLDVTLSTQCASIDGRVVSRNKPAPFARIALLINGTTRSPGDVYLGNADEDGRFSFPAGRPADTCYGRGIEMI
jgi:hypothetical protein